MKFALALVQPDCDGVYGRCGCDDQVVPAIVIDVGRLKGQHGAGFSEIGCQVKFRAACSEVDVDLINRAPLPNRSRLGYLIPVQIMIQPSAVREVPVGLLVRGEGRIRTEQKKYEDG